MNSGAVTPVIATLLLVAIAVVGGSIIFVFSQGFFSTDHISGSPEVESLEFTKIEVSNNVVFLTVQNQSIKPVVFEEVLFHGMHLESFEGMILDPGEEHTFNFGTEITGSPQFRINTSNGSVFVITVDISSETDFIEINNQIEEFIWEEIEVESRQCTIGFDCFTDYTDNTKVKIDSFQEDQELQNRLDEFNDKQQTIIKLLIEQNAFIRELNGGYASDVKYRFNDMEKFNAVRDYCIEHNGLLLNGSDWVMCRYG